MKKKWVIIVIILLVLIFCCWLIGKKLYPNGATWRQNDLSQTINESGTVNSQDINEQGPDVGIQKRSIEILNAGKTEDNPWGVTAGVVDADGYCIFLTPGTGAMITLTDDEDKPSLEMQIHPQMISVSDGVGVSIQLLDEGEHILLEMKETVRDSVIPFIPDWQKYKGCQKVVIQCDDGGQGNSDADWLLIREIPGTT